MNSRRSSCVFRAPGSLIATMACVSGSLSCFMVNMSLFAALTVWLGCARESRFSGKLESRVPAVRRADMSDGLTAPEEDPPLLAAKKPLLVDIELDCRECAALMVEVELTRLSSDLGISPDPLVSFVGFRVGTKPWRLCRRLDDEEAVSLRLRLMSLPSVSRGATPGLFTIDGAFEDATRACDRCGTGGGR